MFIMKRSISTQGFKNSTSKLKPKFPAQTSEMNKKQAKVIYGLNKKTAELSYLQYKVKPLITTRFSFCAKMARRRNMSRNFII